MLNMLNMLDFLGEPEAVPLPPRKSNMFNMFDIFREMFNVHFSMSDMFKIPRVSRTFSYECARNPGNVKHVGCILRPQHLSAFYETFPCGNPCKHTKRRGSYSAKGLVSAFSAHSSFQHISFECAQNPGNVKHAREKKSEREIERERDRETEREKKN